MVGSDKFDGGTGVSGREWGDCVCTGWTVSCEGFGTKFGSKGGAVWVFTNLTGGVCAWKDASFSGSESVEL